MGRRKGKELGATPVERYHSIVDVLDRDVTVDKVEALERLASAYAEDVIASLPEDDPEVLHKGLTGAFLSFLGDAVGVLSKS